jgi:hypothetical protein
LNTAWKTPLIRIIDSALKGGVEETRRLVTDLINQKIDIQGIHEDLELMMFDGFTRFAVAATALYLDRKRAASKFQYCPERFPIEKLLSVKK